MRIDNRVTRSFRRTTRSFLPVFDLIEDRIVMSVTFPISSGGEGTGFPLVAMDKMSGESVVAWFGSSNNESTTDVFFEIVPAGGSSIPPVNSGTQITNSQSTGSNYSLAGVAMNDDGVFVVAYVATNSSNPANNGESFQRYSSTGTALGSPVFVGSMPGDRRFESVGIDDQNDVVVVQNGLPVRDPYSLRIDAEEYSSTNSTAGPFNITNVALQMGDHSFSMDESSGSFVVSYTTTVGSQPAVEDDVFGAFSTSGTTFEIATDSNVFYPSVSMNNYGEIATSWMDSDGSDPTTVQVALISSTGTTISGGGTVFNDVTGIAGATSIALNDSGNYVTTWDYMPSNSNNYIFNVATNLQNYIQISTTGNLSNDDHFIAIDDLGDYIVVWNSQAGNPPGEYGYYN